MSDDLVQRLLNYKFTEPMHELMEEAADRIKALEDGGETMSYEATIEMRDRIHELEGDNEMLSRRNQELEAALRKIVDWEYCEMNIQEYARRALGEKYE